MARRASTVRLCDQRTREWSSVVSSPPLNVSAVFFRDPPQYQTGAASSSNDSAAPALLSGSVFQNGEDILFHRHFPKNRFLLRQITHASRARLYIGKSVTIGVGKITRPPFGLTRPTIM